MRRFKQLIAGRHRWLSTAPTETRSRFRNSAKALVRCCLSPARRLLRQRHDTMNALRPLIRLAPITAGLTQRNPKILLGGRHQPTLLRYLDGWPRRTGRPSAFLIQFVDDSDSLARFATDSFDLAVIQAPNASEAGEVIRQLTRIARQGLITRR
jgi:hypothetical protein